MTRVLAFLLILSGLPNLWGDDSARLHFFENRIRPVLIEACYECHSTQAGVAEGGLYLDSAAGLRQGGDSGPALVPGKPEESLLLAALQYEALEMPPTGALPEKVITDFKAWIADGALDPRVTDGPRQTKPVIDIERGREFWAFQPPQSRPAPRSSTPSSSVIDAFLDAPLHEAGIQPQPAASPAVRLRRLAFDLTGMPPTAEQIESFTRDPSPQHWRRLVDAYLSSPAYAEHWARHILDIARYADSNGSDFNATFHDAWRYRDWVIESIAGDLPVDRMIRMQIAGDLLPAENDRERFDNLVATTFLMLGSKQLSERDKAKLRMDVVDEQIDTVGRAFLGLTLGCARCHDHKFDPIPTEDYYALAGIFRSTLSLQGESQKYVSTWPRHSLPTSAEHVRAVEEFNSRHRKLSKRIKQAEEQLKQLKGLQQNQLAGTVVDDTQAVKTGVWKDSTYFKTYVGQGYVHDDNKNKGKLSITFTADVPAAGEYEVRLAFAPGSNRAGNVPIRVETADGAVDLVFDQRVATSGANWGSLGVYRFAADEPARVVISNTGTSGYVIADAVQWLPQDASSPREAASHELHQLEKAEQELTRLQDELAQLEWSEPAPLPTAMAVIDRPVEEVHDARICVRGEPDNLGEEVARGFLTVCSGSPTNIPETESGRRQLSDWITDPDNPLTARVFVNRVWMHLFGHGIVRTVDNFGQLGERPTHPELLDTLAVEFVRGGWSLRRLIRRIVLSDAYGRSSAFDEASYAVDPENRLLWRGNRRRLPVEAIRDTLLVASGQLDRMPSVDPMADYGTLVRKNDAAASGGSKEGPNFKRTIYVPIIRNELPAMLTTFDFANPNMLVGRRPVTNVPAQGLYMLNSPQMLARCEQIAERIQSRAATLHEQIRGAYLACLQRSPGEEELMMSKDFLKADPQGLPLLVQALIASTEFRLLD